MPNQYQDDEVAMILEEETRQRLEEAAKQALGEPARQPGPTVPPADRPAEDRPPKRAGARAS